MAEEKPEIVYIPISTDTRNMLNEMRRGRDTYNSVIRRMIKEAAKK
jgi:predicted CopG family antitoxin